MFPFAEVIEENGLANKSVLLSYRTQQLLLMAMAQMEKRYLWQDMSDAEWDELSDYVAKAETEILTIESAAMSTYQEIERTTTQSIPSNILTKIIFPNVTGLGTDVYVTETGIATVTARVAVSSSSSGLQYARLLHEGVEIARDDNRSTGQLQYFELTDVLEVGSGDVIALEVFALVGTTVQITPFTPQVKLVII